MTRVPSVPPGLLGAGASAREVASYLPDGVASFHAVGRAFLPAAPVGSIDIEHPSDTQRDSAVLATPGAPGLRRELVGQWPGRTYAVLVADGAHVDPSAVLGEGTVIAPGAVVTTDVLVGRHGQVNIGATISHDCVLGDFVTLGPGAHLAGRVRIGDGVLVGAGAVVVQGVRVADGAVVGAGAVVLHDVTDVGAVVVGTPARLVRIREDWLDEL